MFLTKAAPVSSWSLLRTLRDKAAGFAPAPGYTRLKRRFVERLTAIPLFFTTSASLLVSHLEEAFMLDYRQQVAGSFLELNPLTSDNPDDMRDQTANVISHN
jgi:hypothetical protein